MIHHLTCCICGEEAGKFEQHWNRDTGWGVCPRCVSEQAVKESPDEIQFNYGKVGVNYEQPMVRYMGRQYKVLGTTKNEDQANAFMARTEGASVLTVLDDGVIVIVDKSDEGVVIAGCPDPTGERQ